MNAVVNYHCHEVLTLLKEVHKKAKNKTWAEIIQSTAKVKNNIK